MARRCVLPGCKLRVGNCRHYLCYRCWKEYGTYPLPAWVRALVQLAAVEEKREKRWAGRIVSLSLFGDSLPDGNDPPIIDYTIFGKGLGGDEIWDTPGERGE